VSSSNMECIRKSRRVKTLYTTQAPIELISFFYRISREAREQGSATSLKYLPDDTPIPEPISRERSFASGTLSASQSELSIFRLNRASQRQILQTSLSWLGLSMSNLNSDQSLRLTSKIQSRNPSSISLDEDDIKILADEGSEMSLTPLSPKIKSRSFSGRELALDSVGEDHSMDVYLSLSHLGFGRPHVSSLSKRPKRSTLYPARKINRRCNSYDFAFSEANEVSQVNVSTITSPKDAKKFLIFEEKEEHDPLMSLLKTDLSNRKSKKLVSRFMRKSRRSRDARRRENLSNVLRKTDSLLAGALLRAATENYEDILSSKVPDNGRKKISRIDENMRLRISNIGEEKADLPQ